MGKKKAGNLLETYLARTAGNALRDTIAESVEDGILTDSEERNIHIGHFVLYGALKNANDETLLPGETSPFFSQPFLDTNPHGGTPESILNLPRAGFEISGLNAISENGSNQAINLNLPSEITKHATSDIIPLSIDDLIAYLYSPHSQYNPITAAHSGTGSSATSGTGAVGGFIPPSDGGSQGGGSPPPSGGSSNNEKDDDQLGGGSDLAPVTSPRPVVRPPNLGDGSGSSSDSGNFIDDFIDDVIDVVSSVIGFLFGKPIILDLDGDAVQLTELSNSTIFMDATGDGLANATAWAAAGNGVLLRDPDNTGEITEKRQYVFCA